jgi:hypothetical protein
MINNPTAAWNLYENSWNIVTTMFNKPLDPVQSGPYFGMNRLERSLIKMTPARAIIEAKDPKSKMAYYDGLIQYSK